MSWMNTPLDPGNAILSQVYPYVIHFTYSHFSFSLNYQSFLARVMNSSSFPPFNSFLNSSNDVNKILCPIISYW